MFLDPVGLGDRLGELIARESIAEPVQDLLAMSIGTPRADRSRRNVDLLNWSGRAALSVLL